MMASDSDESDYEDARQHHDNEPDDDTFSPISRLVRASSSTNSTTSGVVVFSSSESQGESRREQTDDQHQVAPPENHQQQLQPSNNENNQVVRADQQVSNLVENENILENAGASGNNDEALADEINPAEFEAVAARVNEEAERVLIRLQGYFRDNPNPVVVDSDDDDVDTISDDSELDFPLLNAENDGESEFKLQKIHLYNYLIRCD